MAFQRIHGWGQKVAEGGLVGEEAEEAAGLKLAAGLAMAESFGSCSGACNRVPKLMSGIAVFEEKLTPLPLSPAAPKNFRGVVQGARSRLWLMLHVNHTIPVEKGEKKDYAFWRQ
ncbi:MAG: hypothetical protein FRX49_08722 [Trebouxia sp. A1-2]|nr:MAG: hypothetical protein FRX49_08722 [Trebouxia sp. A1-2]